MIPIIQKREGNRSVEILEYRLRMETCTRYKDFLRLFLFPCQIEYFLYLGYNQL